LTVDSSPSTIDHVSAPRSVITLRVLLSCAFVVVTFAQLRAVPAIYDDWVRDAPAAAVPRWPLLVLALLLLATVQVVIVCVWRLLTMVAERRIFSEASFAWVDAVVVVLAAACALVLVAFVHSVLLGEGAALPVVLLLLEILAAVGCLLMVVMRALLRQAASLQAELEDVV
jgi:hypothetical protein